MAHFPPTLSVRRHPIAAARMILRATVVVAAAATTALAAPTFEARLLAVDANEACAIADFNNDGVPDLSAGRNWYAGPDFVPRPLRDVAEFGKDYFENNGEHAHDVNGDGWTDVISGSFFPAEVHWYENPGNPGLERGKLWKPHLLATTTTKNEITCLRDIDGDGTPEYIANSWQTDTPQAIWKLSTRDGQPTMEACPVGDCNGHGIGFGDVNGDGHEDLLFGNGWYERPANAPLTQPWTLHRDWNWPHASCPMVVTDLNRDGRNDIIYGNGHDYGLYWMEQLAPIAGKTQWHRHLIDDSWSQAHALLWVDLDGDGREELVTGKRVRGHSGRDPGADEMPSMFCYTWDAKELKFTRHLIAEGVGTGLIIRHADLDGNGKTDLAVAGKSGTWILLQK